MSEVAEPDDGVAEAGGGPHLPAVVPMLTTYALAMLAIVAGVLLGPSFVGTSLQSNHPGSAHSLVPLAIGLTVGTLSILAVVRLGMGELLLRVAFLGVFAGLIAQAAFVLAGLAPAVVVGALVFAAMWVHPEWYVVNLVGLGYIAVANAVLGVSLVPGLIIAALVAMALYDAYSVYVSEHMQSLVEGSTVMDLPMGFVVPRDLGFSLEAVDSMLETDADVSFLGFGDAFFPGILAVSAGHFVDAPTLLAGVPFLNAPALGAIVGGVVGMVGLHVLMKYVERAHPALVVLNPAVVGGYLVGAVAAGVPLLAALGL